MTPRTVLMTADAVSGVWRYAVDLGAALHKLGVDVILAVMGPPPTSTDRHDAERAGLVVIARPYRLEWMDEPWDDVRRAGRWLLTLERMVQPDIVHLNGYVHASLGWSKPVVVAAHSCRRTWWKAVKGTSALPRFDAYSAAVKAGLTAAGAVVTPSDAMRTALAGEYDDCADMLVIPNGRAPYASRNSVRKDDVILSVGRAWDDGKNIGALCEVGGKVSWPIYVAGDVRRPDGVVCELPDVYVLGRLDARELSKWYDRAAIYALPARYEPFGLSVLEAASAGCALVLGDIDSLREHWDGAAIFVPSDDRLALTNALRELIGRPDYRRRLGLQASLRAALFTIERTAAAYINLYDRLIAKRRCVAVTERVATL